MKHFIQFPALVILTAMVFLLQSCAEDIVFQNGTEIVYIDDGVHVLRCTSDGRQLAPQSGGHYSTVSEYYYDAKSAILICMLKDPSNTAWYGFVVVNQRCHGLQTFSSIESLNLFLEEKGLESFFDIDFKIVG